MWQAGINRRYTALQTFAGLAALAGLLGGCAPDYGDVRADAPAAAMPPRESWSASGSVQQPELAVDGNGETAARGGSAQTGLTLEIDLSRPGLFNLVTIDHASADRGHARQVQVLTSLTGQRFTPQAEAPGNRRVTMLWLPQPVLARYIRLQAESGEGPWTIAEIHLQ